ncbi:MAG: hypothetical protein WCJ61_00090 [Paludibacter sp.]
MTSLLAALAIYLFTPARAVTKYLCVPKAVPPNHKLSGGPSLQTRGAIIWSLVDAQK